MMVAKAPDPTEQLVSQLELTIATLNPDDDRARDLRLVLAMIRLFEFSHSTFLLATHPDPKFKLKMIDQSRERGARCVDAMVSAIQGLNFEADEDTQDV